MKPAIIVDIDGTLAIIGDRSPYAAEFCYRDEPNDPVRFVVNQYFDNDLGCVILMSGRQEKHRPHTEEWLNEHGIRYDRLYMRETNDGRKDTVVKRELYEQHVAGHFQVQFVLDDRSSVVKMWREELGLSCWQVELRDV